MTRIQITSTGNLRTEATHEKSGAVIQTDAPKDNEGKGELFSPTDLLAASLGTCILTLMGIVAHKLKADLTGLRATVDKEMRQSPSRRVGRIVIHVYCPQQLDPEARLKIEQAGTDCPVHESLHPDVQQEIVFHWGTP